MNEVVRDGGRRERIEEESGVATLRRLLLALVLFGCVGLLIELFLLEHFESVWQWLPFAVLGAALVSGAGMFLRPGRRMVRLFQTVMAIMLVTGVAGVWLHYAGNRAFELEMEPGSRGLRLVWLALRGATPALAPGAMVQLALLGLIVAYRHPGLSMNRTQ